MMWPDPHSSVLPTLAYLRSLAEQTVPARRLAVNDSVAHFRGTTAADSGLREMAFLGVVADVMQVLEDLAYFGEAFSTYRFPGLPFYVGAIAFDARGPTRFYQRRRSDRDLRVLAGFVVRARDGAETHILDPLAQPLSPVTRNAWDVAEQETMVWLRAHLDGLRETWERFSRYFQAFKHGGLLINGDDVELIADAGERIRPSVGVWRTRRAEAEGHGHADGEVDLAEVVRDLELRAELALDVLGLLVDNRIVFSEQAAAGPPDVPQETIPMTLPARFRFSRGVPEASIIRELEALGVRFT